MIRLKRLPNWRSRLFWRLLRHACFRFAYGPHDCGILAADTVAAVTGFDPAAAYRGRYRSRGEALRLLRAAGYADHIDFATRHFETITPELARPGDIGVVRHAGAVALAPILGRVALAYRPQGLAFVPLTMVERAFKVG